MLDPAPPRSASAERLALLEQGDPASIVLAVLGGSSEPMSRADLARRALLSPLELGRGTRGGPSARRLVHDPGLARRAARPRGGTARRARRSARRSIPVSRSPSCCRARPWAGAALAQLPLERRGAKAYAPGASAHLGDRAAAAAALEDGPGRRRLHPVEGGRSRARGVPRDRGPRRPPGRRVRDRRFRLRRRAGAGSWPSARRQARSRSPASAISLGIGRRAAQLILERLDADGVTRRVGEERVLAQAGALPLCLTDRRTFRRRHPVSIMTC